MGLTRARAGSRQQGITVNAVCPGYTDTEIVRASIERVVAKTGRSEQEARAAFVQQPTRPAGGAAEVADAVPGSAQKVQCHHRPALSVSGGEVMSA